jgi:hypothetical protein
MQQPLLERDLERVVARGAFARLGRRFAADDECEVEIERRAAAPARALQPQPPRLHHTDLRNDRKRQMVALHRLG